MNNFLLNETLHSGVMIMKRHDLTGQRFGSLTAKKIIGKDQHGLMIWSCLCDCGNMAEVTSTNLRLGRKLNCGTRKNHLKNNLIGQQFSKLTVFEYAGRQKSNGNSLWKCKCSCGNETIVDSNALKSGRTRSCGCLRRKASSKRILDNPAMIASMRSSNSFRDCNGNPVQSVIKSSRNKSGVIGVSHEEKEDKWIARLMVDGKYVLNARFDCFNMAVSARKNAENKYLKNAQK